MKKKVDPSKLKRGDVIEFKLDHPATIRGVIIAEDGDAFDIINVLTGQRKRVKKADIDVVDKRAYASRYVKDIRGDNVVFEFFDSTHEIRLEDSSPNVGKILVYTTSKEKIEGVVSERKDTGVEVLGFDGKKHFVKNSSKTVRLTKKKVFAKLDLHKIRTSKSIRDDLRQLVIDNYIYELRKIFLGDAVRVNTKDIDLDILNASLETYQVKEPLTYEEFISRGYTKEIQAKFDKTPYEVDIHPQPIIPYEKRVQDLSNKYPGVNNGDDMLNELRSQIAKSRLEAQIEYVLRRDTRLRMKQGDEFVDALTDITKRFVEREIYEQMQSSVERQIYSLSTEEDTISHLGKQDYDKYLQEYNTSLEKFNEYSQIQQEIQDIESFLYENVEYFEGDCYDYLKETEGDALDVEQYMKFVCTPLVFMKKPLSSYATLFNTKIREGVYDLTANLVKDSMLLMFPEFSINFASGNVNPESYDTVIKVVDDHLKYVVDNILVSYLKRVNPLSDVKRPKKPQLPEGGGILKYLAKPQEICKRPDIEDKDLIVCYDELKNDFNCYSAQDILSGKPNPITGEPFSEELVERVKRVNSEGVSSEVSKEPSRAPTEGTSEVPKEPSPKEPSPKEPSPKEPPVKVDKRELPVEEVDEPILLSEVQQEPLRVDYDEDISEVLEVLALPKGDGEGRDMYDIDDSESLSVRDIENWIYTLDSSDESPSHALLIFNNKGFTYDKNLAVKEIDVGTATGRNIARYYGLEEFSDTIAVVLRTFGTLEEIEYMKKRVWDQTDLNKILVYIDYQDRPTYLRDPSNVLAALRGIKKKYFLPFINADRWRGQVRSYVVRNAPLLLNDGNFRQAYYDILGERPSVLAISDKIVDFGKYKGLSYQQLKTYYRDYTDWLVQQDWVRENEQYGELSDYIVFSS